MKLIRKQTSNTVKDIYGIHHPYLTITYSALLEDKMNKWLEIHCKYHHTLGCEYDALLNFPSILMRFDSTSIEQTPENVGWPTYTSVKTQIDINNNGQLVILDPSVYNWILIQPYVRDFEGKVFAENWEIID